jgi:hypothetical protein
MSDKEDTPLDILDRHLDAVRQAFDDLRDADTKGRCKAELKVANLCALTPYLRWLADEAGYWVEATAVMKDDIIRQLHIAALEGKIAVAELHEDDEQTAYVVVFREDMTLKAIEYIHKIRREQGKEWWTLIGNLSWPRLQARFWPLRCTQWWMRSCDRSGPATNERRRQRA